MDEKKKWKVSHNNEREVVIESATQEDAIKERLKQLGLDRTEHPVRVWPANMGEK